MHYHSPDNRWPLYQCNDYDTYLDKFLVKGRFHAAVTQDVKDSYETVEQLMAHAWYHYPLYDEAMNKLLRTFEIAIKQKCALLQIPVQAPKKNGENRNIDLAVLIKEINKLERDKKQSIFLEHLRYLRNEAMHPNRHSFMGGMLYNKIIQTVNILNILFAEESYFLQLEQKENLFQTSLSLFNQKALVFQRGQEFILLHNFHFDDIVILNTDQILLLLLEPALGMDSEMVNQKKYPFPISLELKSPKLNNNILTGTDANNGQLISISIASHPIDVKASEDFRKYLFSIKIPIEGSTHNIIPYLNDILEEQSRCIQHFRYKYYCQLK